MLMNVRPLTVCILCIFTNTMYTVITAIRQCLEQNMLIGEECRLRVHGDYNTQVNDKNGQERLKLRNPVIRTRKRFYHIPSVVTAT